MQIKEMAENMGYEVLHGIVDCQAGETRCMFCWFDASCFISDHLEKDYDFEMSSNITNFRNYFRMLNIRPASSTIVTTDIQPVEASITLPVGKVEEYLLVRRRWLW